MERIFEEDFDELRKIKTESNSGAIKTRKDTVLAATAVKEKRDHNVMKKM